MRNIVVLVLLVLAAGQQYRVNLLQRDSQPLLSYLEVNNSFYKQVFNPTWVPPSEGTQQKQGLLIRTQNC
jgi:predicted GH43/DUF377 family glycosyl hydrolase